MKKSHIFGLCVGASIFGMTPMTVFASTFGQKAISINQQAVSRPFGTVHNATTYMPIWYLMDALNKEGVKTGWDGHALYLSSDSTPNLSNVNPGNGAMSIYVDGHLVQNVDGTVEPDPASSGTATTYMPVWYLQQALNRMNVNNDWSGFDLNIGLGSAVSDNGNYDTVVSVPTNRSRSDSSSSSSTVSGQDIVNYAKQFIGVPYAYGGESTSGMDCSGLVQTVFKHFGVSLPRTSAEQAQVGQAISKSDLQPGDLVFFNTEGQAYSHVGIYVGNDQFISATSSKGVKIYSLDDPYYWGPRFTRATNPLA